MRKNISKVKKWYMCTDKLMIDGVSSNGSDVEISIDICTADICLLALELIDTLEEMTENIHDIKLDVKEKLNEFKAKK